MEEKIKDQIKQEAKEKARIEAPSMQAFAKHYFEVGANFILPLIEKRGIAFAEWVRSGQYLDYLEKHGDPHIKNNGTYYTSKSLYNHYQKFLSETQK